MVRTTADLRQAADTISTQCKELAKVAQLSSALKCLEDIVGFFEASEKELERI